MRFKIKEDSKVDFLAYAPLHKFRGNIEEGFSGSIEIDFEKKEITEIDIVVETKFFKTGDFLKDKEMHKYISSKKIKTASFKLKKFKKMKKLKKENYQIELIGVLKFMDIERDLDLKFTIEKKEDSIETVFKFVWSFKNYGLEPPHLLFIKVKDKVDITAILSFELV